jgi:hypothetical protein
MSTLQEGKSIIPLNEGAKVVIEKYVDSPEEAKRVVEDKKPIMTLSRAKRLIDQGLHIHDEKEYIHCLSKVSSAKKIHGIWHCPITADTLKSVMNEATFDLGEHVY